MMTYFSSNSMHGFGIWHLPWLLRLRALPCVPRLRIHRLPILWHILVTRGGPLLPTVAGIYLIVAICIVWPRALFTCVLNNTCERLWAVGIYLSGVFVTIGKDFHGRLCELPGSFGKVIE